MRAADYEGDEPGDVVASADLPGGSPEAAWNEFVAEHAKVWMPAFAEAVQVEARVPFYRQAATAARRAKYSSSSSSVHTASSGSLVPSGRPNPQALQKRSTAMECGFTNKSGCTPSAVARHTPS